MKHVLGKLLFFIALLITTASVATPTHWRLLQPGLDYTKLSMLSGFHVGYLHAFRIDLTKYELKSAIAEDDSDKIASVEDLAIANKAIVGINGGFFSQELKPLGLRISHHTQRIPLKATPWWSVFYVANGHPFIINQKLFQWSKNIEFAVQSGPRLIVNNQIPLSLKPGVDSRTAIGITTGNRVIVVVTENLNLTTTQLAELLRRPYVEGGLGCINALNLDGGSSSQLYARAQNFLLQVTSHSAVTDAILVVPRNTQ